MVTIAIVLSFLSLSPYYFTHLVTEGDSLQLILHAGTAQGVQFAPQWMWDACKSNIRKHFFYYYSLAIFFLRTGIIGAAKAIEHEA